MLFSLGGNNEQMASPEGCWNSSSTSCVWALSKLWLPCDALVHQKNWASPRCWSLTVLKKTKKTANHIILNHVSLRSLNFLSFFCWVPSMLLLSADATTNPTMEIVDRGISMPPNGELNTLKLPDSTRQLARQKKN